MKLFFDEIGCDWGIQATVTADAETRDEVATACREMARVINTALGRDAVTFTDDTAE